MVFVLFAVSNSTIQRVEDKFLLLAHMMSVKCFRLSASEVETYEKGDLKYPIKISISLNMSVK